MSTSLTLYRLQELFTKRARLKKRLAEIEQILNSDSSVQKALQEKEQAIAISESKQKSLRELQSLTSEKRLKKERTHAALFGGKINNSKDLQDLQTEEAMLEELLQKLGEQEFSFLTEAEKASKAVEDAEKNYRQKLDQKASEDSLILGERSKLEGELPQLNTQLKALAASLKPEVLSQFQALLRSKKGKAIVEINDGSCTGCGVDLTLAEIQQAKSSEKPIICRSCGRMLYFVN